VQEYLFGVYTSLVLSSAAEIAALRKLKQRGPPVKLTSAWPPARIATRICLLIVFLIHAVPNGVAQQSNGATSAMAPRVNKISPFNDRVESLPPNFAGNDAEAIYDLVKAKLPNPAKSEFESISEYETRVHEFASKALAGSTKGGDLFAFSVSGSPSTNPDLNRTLRCVDTEYDAESRTFTVKLSSALVGYLPDDHEWSPLWRLSHEYLGEYVGSNAFGVKRKITRWRENGLVIVAHGSKWLAPDCQVTDFDIACPVQANGPTARLLSQNLRVIIVGRLTAPFISFESDTSPPTIDEPAELHNRTKYLHVELEQLWLTDAANGRVLHKYSRTEHEREYPIKVQIRPHNDYQMLGIRFSTDGEKEQNTVRPVVTIEAKHFVDVELSGRNIAYDVNNHVEVLLNGQPYDLKCNRHSDGDCSGTYCKGRISIERQPDDNVGASSLGAFGISPGDRWGLKITRLTPGGPAQTAGLAVGDVITGIDGKQVRCAFVETEIVSTRPQGSSLRVEYYAGGARWKQSTVVLRNGEAVSATSGVAGRGSSSSDLSDVRRDALATRITPHQIGETFQEWLTNNGIDLDDICKTHKGNQNPRSDNLRTAADFKAVCKRLSLIRDTGYGDFYLGIEGATQALRWRFAGGKLAEVTAE
jgi:hypothetical protein